MNTEEVANWFFRLNGCFTIPNFIVHPDASGGQRTDADVLAVRFQHRSELPDSPNPMEDHEIFRTQSHLISVWFGEVKAGTCAINGPWSRPEQRNLQRVLSAIGILPPNLIESTAVNLYNSKRYECTDLRVAFASIGRETSTSQSMQPVVQLTWVDVLCWIHHRLSQYAQVKADNSQWDRTGKRLYRSVTRSFENDPDGFIEASLDEIGVARK